MSKAIHRKSSPIGADPNDSTWILVRYAKDWAKGRLERLIFDPTRGVLELEPLLPINDRWLPLEPVTDRLGNQFQSDPANHRILHRPCCEAEFQPLDGLGGFGWDTGRLNRPLGLAVNARGWLLVADAGNHRVQVVRPDDGSVVAVLGATDPWGHPASGTATGAMMEPVHAAVDPCSGRIYIADREAGLIHVFDARFVHELSFEPGVIAPDAPSPTAAGTHPRPVAVAVLEDGSIAVLDATRPRLLHMTAEGRPLTDISVESAASLFSGSKPLKARFERTGEAILGPLDGQVYDQKWHRILVDADVPAGSSVSIQTCASNDRDEPTDSLPWAPFQPVGIPLKQVEGVSGEYSRLVLSDVQRWRRTRHGDYQRDRPVVHQFSGDGPASGDAFRIPGAAAVLLRAGDTVRLERGGAAEQLPIHSIQADYQIEFTASGSARIFGAGSQVLLLERKGRPMPGQPRLLYEFGAGESLDLSAADTHGRTNRATLAHALGAFLLEEDAIEISEGGDRIGLGIERVILNDATVTLSQPVGADYSTSTLRLLDTPGRLVAKDLNGFEVHPVLHEGITVRDNIGWEKAAIHLVEPERQTIWLEPGSLGTLVSFENWESFKAEPARSTDIGRYLWIRLQLRGAPTRFGDDAAVRTPAIRALRALMPRLSYLTYLPGVYARPDPDKDPSGAVFLERYLALFEEQFTRFESYYESVSRQLNPEASDPDWLAFLSAWLGLVLDPSWPIERRRQVVREAVGLYKRRGTVEGIRRFVEIFTGRRPELVEGFQRRAAKSLVVGRSGTVGCSTLGGDPCDYNKDAYRFKLFVYLEDGSDQETAGPSMQSLVESIKPAHTEFQLCLLAGHPRVGLQSRVGVDTVLGRNAGGMRIGDSSCPDSRRGNLPGLIRATPPDGLRLAQGGVRCDPGLNLK